MKQDPKQFIQNVFKSYDVVLLAESHGVADNLKWLHDLIPTLYDAGVDYIGMEFGAMEDQDKLDRLITNPVYDEKLARELMFHYNVIFPYQEYMDVYRHVHAFNQTLSVGSKPMRILNLSYVFNWKDYTLPDTKEKRDNVFYRGDIDYFRYQRIKQNVLDLNRKIIVLTGTPHAYTKSHIIPHDYQFLGEYLYQYAPSRVTNLFLHEYVYDPHGHQYLPPFDESKEPYCVDLNKDSLGLQPIYPTSNQRWRDIFDGYIYIVPLKSRKSCQIDHQFLDGHRWQDVLDQFPDPNWHEPPANIEAYWNFVQSQVNWINEDSDFALIETV
jgi:hypothetical protein